MEWGPILRAMLTHRARFGLIAVQIATTFAIVANCVALIREAREKLSISSGLDDEHFVGIAGRNPLPKSRGDVERKAWMLQTSEELRRISGVSSSSLSGYRPWACSLRDLIKAANTNTEQTPIGSCLADELLAETIGLRLEEGRWFSHEEVYGETHNIVITRSVAQRLFGDGPVVGKLVQRFGGNISTIIGVVHDLQKADPKLDLSILDGSDPRCGIFIARVRPSSIVMRIEPGKTEEVLQSIEQVLESRNAKGAIAVQTFAASRDKLFGTHRIIVVIMGFLATLLLFIASLGIAGMTSFSITERTRQIGIRRALGATTTDILRYFLTEIAIVTTVGLAVGSVLTVLLNMAILRIYDSAKLEAPIVIGCALLLWFVALGAALPPALRASRISPAIATRNV